MVGDRDRIRHERSARSRPIEVTASRWDAATMAGQDPTRRPDHPRFLS
jgi:hypothetical protein